GSIRRAVAGPSRSAPRVAGGLPPVRSGGREDPDAVTNPPVPTSSSPVRTAAVQTSLGPADAPTTVVSFPGMGNVEGYIPPDPNGAAGPHSYLQAVNNAIAEYDKTGTRPFGP